ncbi:MAG: putative inorganic carbon transporter subunit DabA [Bdellovibrionia bacterium]
MLNSNDLGLSSSQEKAQKRPLPAPIDQKHSEKIIEESLRIATPAWPLQNTVAVNPFWFLKETPFEEQMRRMTQTLHTSLLMPLEFYQQKERSGEILSSQIQVAFNEARQHWPDLPQSWDEFRQKKSQARSNPILCFAESGVLDPSWADRVIHEVGKYAAAYFDEKQALALFPDHQENFWKAWVHAQAFDSSMERFGARGFQKQAQKLSSLDSTSAITQMLEEIGIPPLTQEAYLKRLLATVLGWSTQFKYLEWQRSLQLPVTRSSSTVDLLAVRLAYDFLLLKIAQPEKPHRIEQWLWDLEEQSQEDSTPASNLEYYQQYVYQLAWELSYQSKIARLLQNQKSPEDASFAGKRELKQEPKTLKESKEERIQLVFCIDVRSEMIRRHIEAQDPRFQTFGFAGFFGLPLELQNQARDKNSKAHCSRRLPVLLKPGFQLKPNPSKNQASLALNTPLFRAFRKNSLSSLTYVELFGPLYIQKMIQEFSSTAFSFFNKRHSLPNRFKETPVPESLSELRDSSGEKVPLKDLVAKAAAILKHMGLTTDFARLVWIVGHGAVTQNNAFNSALDCGACGGHAGDLNAQVLAHLLNDPLIRNGLMDHQIKIPQSTVFIPAVHETVTDQIYRLNSNPLDAENLKLITEVEAQLSCASHRTQMERNQTRSSRLDPNPERRSQNWSEVRSEWGLSGNACFVIAPRSRTRGICLESRSFLHDYSWEKDEPSQFQTLELILTAPMVVTNWINMQYYASAVAPQIYSSGNKTTHNLTNESGVVEGNGGDLRVGLTFQSIHDGERLVHDPLRLSVFVEAPLAAIESIIQKHLVVRQLVENGWLHLIQMDSKTQTIQRRLRNGTYVPVSGGLELGSILTS